MIEINSKRIDATPRSKYRKYAGGGTAYAGGGGTSIDTSNFLKKTGETSQTVAGSLLVTNDIIAYVSGNTGDNPLQFPIASKNALGCVRIGNGINVDENGIISVTGGTGGGGDVTTEMFTGHTSNVILHITADERTKWDKAISDLSIHAANVVSHVTSTERTNWNDAGTKKHAHSNINYLNIINQNLATNSAVQFSQVKSTGDIIAYATSDYVPVFPIASKNALGCVRIGSGINVDVNGIISVTGGTGGGGAEWGKINGILSNQTDLINVLNNKSNTAHTHSASTITEDSSNRFVSDAEKNNWNNKAAGVHSHSYNDLSNKPLIPTNTNQLSNGSGYITGINLSMWNAAAAASGDKNIGNSGNSNFVNIIEDLKITKACTFSQIPKVGNTNIALVSDIHTHNNKSQLDVINQNLATNSAVQFNQIKSTGDIIAYAGGSGTPAPFRYWLPSVDSNSNLSWTNSMSELTPTTRNIRGLQGIQGVKGDKGDAGTGGGGSWNGGTVGNQIVAPSMYINTTGTAYKLCVNGGISAFIDNRNAATESSGSLFIKSNTETQVYGNSISSFSQTTAGRPRLWLNYYKRAGWGYQSELFIGNGDGAGAQVVTINADGNGKLLVKNGTGTLSDRRLKHIFNEEKNILNRIKNINIYQYTRNDDEDKIMRTGVIAQEVAETFPDLAVRNFLNEIDNETYYTVDYATLGTVVAIGASKELNKKIENQQVEINQLKNKINDLEVKLNQLINQINKQ